MWVRDDRAPIMVLVEEIDHESVNVIVIVDVTEIAIGRRMMMTNVDVFDGANEIEIEFVSDFESDGDVSVDEMMMSDFDFVVDHHLEMMMKMIRLKNGNRKTKKTICKMMKVTSSDDVSDDDDVAIENEIDFDCWMTKMTKRKKEDPSLEPSSTKTASRCHRCQPHREYQRQDELDAETHLLNSQQKPRTDLPTTQVRTEADCSTHPSGPHHCSNDSLMTVDFRQRHPQMAESEPKWSYHHHPHLEVCPETDFSTLILTLTLLPETFYHEDSDWKGLNNKHQSQQTQ